MGDVKHGFCGEACMNPSKINTYKIFEKNLTKADSDSPCIEQFTPTGTHYTEYSETVTHGIPGLLAVTLDLYGPEPEVAVAEPAVAEPCCKSCEEPLEKYFSVDVKHGFCGEICINPSKEGTYKIFEKNLTKADSDSPCIDQFAPTGTHYTEYSETVTHGIPGLLAVTLDLYAPSGMADHSCCVTPFLGNLTCIGIPFKGVGPLTVRGTGPYCCPRGATVDQPCSAGVSV